MSSQQSQSSRLITEPLNQLLYRSTLPVIWGTILLMGFGIVDTFYVSLLGEGPLAAISFTFPVTFTLISLNIGLGIGTAATIGRLLGEGDYSRSRYYAMVAIVLSLLVTGVAVALLYAYKAEIFKLLGVKQDLWPLVDQYITPWLAAGLLLSIPMVCNSVFRANGDTKTPSKIMALGGLINVLLDPVLIFGVGNFAGYGIAGAAIATSIAWLVCSIIVLYHLVINKRWARIEGLSLERIISATKAIVAVSLPASLANMLTPVAGALVMSVIADYGYHAVAAWGVGGRLESIIIIVILSLSMSLPPIVSQNFGAKRYDRVALAYRLAIKFTLVWQLLIYLVGALLAPYIAWIFTDDANVSKLICLYLLIVPLAFGAQGVVILTNSTYNALLQPMKAMLLNIARLFVFVVPFVLIGSSVGDFQGVLVSVVLANIAAAMLSYGVFRRTTGNFSQGQR